MTTISGNGKDHNVIGRVKSLLDKKRYIMLLYIVELFVPVALIYPYTLPIKFICLLLGGVIFFLNISEVKTFVFRKETLFLFFSIVFFSLTCVLNIKQAGLRSIYLWASNIVLFFIIYTTVSNMKIDELKRFMNKLGNITICVTFIFSMMSLVLLITRYTGEYGTGNGIIKRFLSSIGMSRPSDRYGVCSPYFYGITNHSLSIGLESFMSIVMCLYKSFKANKQKLVFYFINICLQFLMIIAAGMRNIALLLMLTLVGIAPFVAIKYLLNKQKKYIFLYAILFSGIILFSCIGGQFVCKEFVSNFMSFERDFEKTGTEENKILTGTEEKDNSSGKNNSAQDKNKDKDKEKDKEKELQNNLPIEKMVIMEMNKHDTLNKLDVLSSGRIRIWLTALKKLTLSTSSAILGYGINEVSVEVQKNVIKSVGLHNEFMSELYTQGFLGIIPNLLFYIGVFICILKKLLCLIKENTCTYEAIIISGAIIATFICSFLGITISYSISIYTIFIWILMGYISNKGISSVC